VLVAESPALDPTDAGRETNVYEIKEEIEQGSYQVDPKAVADAMLRKLFGLRSGRAELPGFPGSRFQNECS
jgi:hypothetical protein